jgi:hypothetical protein
MVEPMAAVVAAEEPEMAAKNIPDTATTWASPPVRDPTMDWAKFTSLRVTPPADMKAPASMKKGTAMKEKESIPMYIICATITWGRFNFTRRNDTDKQRENATGTPTRVRSIKRNINK